MNLDRFTYRNMRPTDGRVVHVREDSVEASAFPDDMAHLSAWVRIDFRGHERKNEARPGWKVHLSVESDDIGPAWDALLPLLAERHLHAKAAGAHRLVDMLADPRHRQAGKTLVVYDGGEAAKSPTFWQEFLSEAERDFVATGVRPGWTVKGDLPLSRYSFVRCDQDRHGRYTEEIDAFNPFCFESPFEGVKLSDRTFREHPTQTATRAARMLDFVVPGGQRSGASWTWRSEEPGWMPVLADCLEAAGIPCRRGGDSVVCDLHATREIELGWHTAMQSARAGNLAVAIKSAFGDSHVENLWVVPASSQSDPPAAVVEFASEGACQATRNVVESLGPGWGPKPTLSGTTLYLPYAGSANGDATSCQRLRKSFQDALMTAGDEAHARATLPAL